MGAYTLLRHTRATANEPIKYIRDEEREDGWCVLVWTPPCGVNAQEVSGCLLVVFQADGETIHSQSTVTRRAICDFGFFLGNGPTENWVQRL